MSVGKSNLVVSWNVRPLKMYTTAKVPEQQVVAEPVRPTNNSFPSGVIRQNDPKWVSVDVIVCVCTQSSFSSMYTYASLLV